MLWTPRQIIRLKWLIEQGMTASQIGEQMGYSKSAIIGKCHREGLSLHFVYAWTKWRQTQLKTMWHEGVSADEIARKLNTTNRAVRSKAGKMGLSPRVGGKKEAPSQELRQSLGTPRIAINPINHAITTVLNIQYEPDPADLRTPEPQQVRLKDLQNHHCRWPIGNPRAPDFFFCGATKGRGSSYCESHHARAYRGFWHPAGATK